MSTSEEPNMDPVLPPSSSDSTTCAPVTKRRREIDLDFGNTEPGVDHEWESKNVPEEAVYQEQTASHTPSQKMYCEFEEEQFKEIHPPQSKRRLTVTSCLPFDSQPLPQAWSQDPLFTCSQYSEDINDSEPSFLNSLQSEDAFGIHVDVEARTSTQKSFKHFHSPQGDEKENSSFLSSKLPRKHSTLPQTEPLSNHKWAKPKTPSPRKHIPVHLWKKADKNDDHDSQFKWTRPSYSPLKKREPQPSYTAPDEDSLAVLFTQDSEGFRVIAHRGLQSRSPLKDQSNISTGTVRASAYKALVEEEEEDEMLFTHDSQGNLVIKHWKEPVETLRSVIVWIWIITRIPSLP